MKTPQTPLRHMSDCAITLNQLVSTIVNSSLTAAGQKNTRLVNEVRQDIALNSGMSQVFNVMEDLLSTVVANSKNGNIHISADCFRDVVILEIQERNNNNGYALAFQINGIEPEAAAFGGHISITGPQRKITTVTFCFPYQVQVA